MKLKNLIITLGLSLTVGAGVLIGVNAVQKEEPKAAQAAVNNVYYFQNTHNWSNMYVHYWGGTGDSTWPGVKLSKACGTDSGHTMYGFENTGGWTSFILHNNSGTQTVDLSFSSFTGSNNAVWINSTQDGSGHKYAGGYWEYSYTTYEKTFYLQGSEIGWGTANGLKMTKTTGSSYYITRTYKAGEKVQAVYYDSVWGDSISWAYNPSSVYCNHGGLYPVSIDGSDAVVSVAGTYTLTVDTSTKAYTFTYDGAWTDPVVKVYYPNGTYGETGTYASSDFQTEFTLTFEEGDTFAFEVKDDVHGTVFYGFEKVQSGDGSSKDAGQVSQGSLKEGTVYWINVAVTQTFSIYVKDSGDIWIQQANDSTQAYAFAKYFLNNVGCDAQGASEPSGWSLVSTRYAALPSTCKTTYFVNGTADEHSANQIEQALARYDYAVTHHAGLTRFIVGRTVSESNRLNVISESMDNALPAIVIVIALVSLTTVGAYYFFKKGKKA